MFASKSVIEHLGRGGIGLAALVATALLAPSHPVLSLALVPVALIALRGCPMCWTVGLVETVIAKLRGRPSDACVDGSCALRPSRRTASDGRAARPDGASAI
jgi:hypothetical protein